MCTGARMQCYRGGAPRQPERQVLAITLWEMSKICSHRRGAAWFRVFGALRRGTVTDAERYEVYGHVSASRNVMHHPVNGAARITTYTS